MIEKIGKTETEMTAEQIKTCRDIVKEILDFGVSQAQMKTIIKFLALELEDRAVMTKVANALATESLRINKNDSSEEKEIESVERKIIT